jgi:hypothetical protein
VLILKVVKVLCFDTLLQVLILNVVSQKMNALAAVTLCLTLIVAPFLRAQSDPNAASSFRIEIQTDIDGKPSFTLTNLSNDTLTACVIRFSLSSKPTWRSELDWDSIVQDSPLKRAEDQPLEAGASVTMYLPHAIGESLPDKVEVVAAIRADGQTFGDAKWVKVILDNRASLALAYEDAIGILQKGLDENWTRDQYLEALDSKPRFYGTDLVNSEHSARESQFGREASASQAHSSESASLLRAKTGPAPQSETSL